jgi:DNA-binding winged helix-turn-helix (wHTH) protein/TolB-like protein
MIYAFNGYEINTENFCICYRGQIVQIEPKVFNVIVYLIQHRDQVVTRKQLLKDVWAGRVVSPSTLTNHIKLARSALGDSGVDQLIISTVYGRGYRFVATDLVIIENDSEINLGHKNSKAVQSGAHANIQGTVPTNLQSDEAIISPQNNASLEQQYAPLEYSAFKKNHSEKTTLELTRQDKPSHHLESIISSPPTDQVLSPSLTDNVNTVPRIGNRSELSGQKCLPKRRAVQMIAISAAVFAVVLLVVAYQFFAYSSRLIVPTIAVLPLVNSSFGQENSRIAKEISNDFCKVMAIDLPLTKNLKFIVVNPEGHQQTDDTRHKYYDVSLVLGGNIQVVEDQLRINIQLVNTRTNQNIWANTYTRNMTLGVRDALPQEIVKVVIHDLLDDKNLSELLIAK